MDTVNGQGLSEPEGECALMSGRQSVPAIRVVPWLILMLIIPQNQIIGSAGFFIDSDANIFFPQEDKTP